MDKATFNEKILAPLEEYGYLGETTNDMGTRLIGHVPHVAPKAYINIVYAPLSNSHLLEFEGRFERPIPNQYKEFLVHANGLNVFSDALRVMGYVPVERKSGSGVYDYPSNIIVPNVSGRIKGLREEEIVVAWYKVDGSYVLLNEAGKAIRFNAKGDGTRIQEWQDFDAWLCAEIATLNEKYKAGEISVFIPSSEKNL